MDKYKSASYEPSSSLFFASIASLAVLIGFIVIFSAAIFGIVSCLSEVVTIGWKTDMPEYHLPFGK